MKKTIKESVIFSLTVFLLFSGTGAFCQNKTTAEKTPADTSATQITSSGAEQTKDGKTAENSAENSDAENSASDTKETKTAATGTVTEDKKTKTSEQKKLKKNFPKIDSYLGSVYLPLKKYELYDSSYSIALDSKSGTFNFYVKDENGKKLPLLADFDDSISSSFFLRIGRTSYRLNKNGAVKKEVRKTEHGAQLAYIVNDAAQVVVDFTFIAPPEKKTDSVNSIDNGKVQDPAEKENSAEPNVFEGVVKVSVSVTNISKKENSFAVKALFDTVAGEGRDFHFTMADGTGVSSEVEFENFAKERAITSSDGKNSIQFVLAGEGVSTVENVALANISNLNKSRWIFAGENGRSFNSVNTYNNSGIAVVWPAKKIKPEKTSEIHFFIGLARDSKNVNSLNYADYLAGTFNPFQPSAVTPVNSVTSVKEDPVFVNTEPKRREYSYTEEETENKAKKNTVDFEVQTITEKQLEPEYIQALINRIDALEAAGDDIDRNEIRQLNAELDAILSTLRKRS